VPSDPRNQKPAIADGRVRAIGVCLLVAFCVLAGRLWFLQVIRGPEFRGKSESNRLRIEPLEAPRGSIFARLGPDQEVVLADNRAARDLLVVPADITIDDKVLCRRLADLSGIDADALLTEIVKARKAREPFKQILVRADIPAPVSARLDEYAYALPGVFTVIRPLRRYVYGKTAGQLLGYVGEINDKELKQRGEHYDMGDLIGRAGVESRYEEFLHGRDGQMLVTKFAVGTPQLRTDPSGNPYIDNLVDSRGHNLKVEEEIQHAEPGDDVHLTLDIGLQQVAERALEGEHGAIAVLNADTGEVLALASAPGYDPAVFVSKTGGRERAEILNGKPNRMIHRAYQEVYAPGSVFKVMLASAALEEGVIDTATKFYCPGHFKITPDGRAWNCWRRQGHGNVDVVDALAFSCDVFFYRVGLELGVDRINEWAKKLGLGEKSGIDLPGEVAGLVPGRAWKEALFKPKHPDAPWEYRWYPGDTVNLSIGQGACNVTPLQNAVLMAAVINGGYRVVPHLNLNTPVVRSERLLSERTLAIVQAGMRKCVEKGPPAPSGTGHAAYIKGMDILGKTGSAQVVSLTQHEQYKTEEDIPKELRDHAWFVAGVLDHEPRLAICILIEHGHHGSSEAAPRAQSIITAFYETWDKTSPADKLASVEAGDE
jgi:penicillin-binding protein 2